MPRTPDQMLTACLAESTHPSRDWSGDCLIFARTMAGVAAAGDYDGDGDADAYDGWERAKHRHPTTDLQAAPRGSFSWWKGGSKGHGHVVVNVGHGQCWTTDLHRPGKVDLAQLSEIHAKWGLQYLGWTEDINGVRIYTPPATPAPTKGTTVALTDFEKRMIASNTRIEAMLEAEMKANGHGKQLDAALDAAEANNKHKGVL